ncbi:methionyl-tRNA formyltransferase [Halalkalibacterium ligniniphilum]|uniref:methionyl-tRNA formyltransferase n=1 Tax=Halalkalibacterium ligniniphilum TaxID=1134413 RepID=UPI000349240D|nr:methionyl-tRNA formyltransferase [Halalkalibacterium ligniniphilum]
MKIVFMGTPDFSVPVLRRLIEDGYKVAAVVTQPDRPVGRKRVLTPPPVKAEAELHGIPVLQPEKIREEAELKKVLAFEPDLIVTAAFGQILPKTLLDYPKHGCINVHASLLPKYRGGAPIHQAIIDGEAETGVTIMYMVEKLDAGDILTQAAVPIEANDHVGTLHNKLSEAGAALLGKTIPLLLSGEIKPKKQKDEEATFARNISREMEKLDWSKAGEVLYNQIRGLHPWPVAYTMWNKKPLKIWWAEIEQKNMTGEPGTVLALEKDGIVVATGNETPLKITDLQPSGKKRMLAGEFLRGSGSSMTVGTRLGDDDGE